MRTFIIGIAAIGLVLALAGCSQPSGPSAGMTEAGPATRKVWNTLLSNKAYQKWATAPGFQTRQPAKGPHGKMVQVFVDPNITRTLSGPAATAWPAGSMIVKDAFDAAGSPMQIEYMQKTSAGWYYASFGLDGTLVKEGVNAVPCAPCHATGSDSVKSFKLP